MNIAAKSLGITIASFTALQQAWAINFGSDQVDGSISGTAQGDTADKAVQKLVANAMIFLAIVAVLYGLYGGFLILTAGGADDKVKQGKTILIQVAIGLVVIFLANSVVQFVLKKILGGGGTATPVN